MGEERDRVVRESERQRARERDLLDGHGMCNVCVCLSVCVRVHESGGSGMCCVFKCEKKGESEGGGLCVWGVGNRDKQTPEGRS